MKYSFLALLITCLLSSSLHGQDCNILSQLHEEIIVQKFTDEERDYSYAVARLDMGRDFDCDILNQNVHAFNYIIPNLSRGYDELLEDMDSMDRQAAFFEKFEQDTFRYAALVEWNSKLNGESGKDTVTTRDVMNLAVKYFSIIGLTPEGYYRGKVCAGWTEIPVTESKRDLLLEAFAFSAVFEHSMPSEFDVIEEFKTGLRKLYQLELGTDPEEKLMRARGALYMAMLDSEVLLELLQSEYEERKETLPFYWAEMEA
ncbi:MAG: hypothetical protein HWE14_05220 [Flavobacteriia bacterium]|nr:hypothetical protein [Flavobacteriia bacterium]